MIRFFHVTKRYGRSLPPAISDVTFAVGKGELAFLTGASGAGKSTILKLICCSERADDGQIFVGGNNVTRASRFFIPKLRRAIGVVFQDFRLLPKRTVGENVALTLDVLGTPRRETSRRVQSALAQVGLLSRLNDLPKCLSGGEQQRVAIARAIVNDPAVILADEPTGNLDGAMAGEVMELLRSLALKGTTILVATHDMGLVERFDVRRFHLEESHLEEIPGRK